MLTFESIREMERKERGDKKLQRLPENVVSELRDYLKRKEGKAEKSSEDIVELENIKRVINRFFELRENKIVEMALSTVRTGLPPNGLTKEERVMFDKITDLIKEHREVFFTGLHREEKPEEKAEEKREVKEEKKERIIYRVKKELQEFVGPDMKTYRLIRGEIVNLPKPLNDLLLKEGVIEEIRE